MISKQHIEHLTIFLLFLFVKKNSTIDKKRLCGGYPRNSELFELQTFNGAFALLITFSMVLFLAFYFVLKLLWHLYRLIDSFVSIVVRSK